MWLNCVIPFAYSLPFWFKFNSWFNFFIFLISLWGGYFFYFIDYFISPFYHELPDGKNQQYIYLLKRKQYFSYLKYCFINRHLYQKLLTRSMLFVALVLPLTLLMITSVGSVIGMGLTLGLSLANLIYIFSLKIDTLKLINFFSFYHQAITATQLRNIKILFSITLFLLTLLALYK